MDAVAKTYGVEPDEAFERIAFSILGETSLVSLSADDIVDGGGDKQIDIVRINEEEGKAEVLILQVTKTEKFESNKLVAMGNGLRWFFADPESLNSLANKALRDKILEFRSIMNQIGPSNMRVKAFFVTNGLTSAMSPEFDEELANQQAGLPQGLFDEFTLGAAGADELVDMLNAMERQPGQIDADLRIVWSASEPTYIRYTADDIQGIVCTIPATEIARLVEENLNKNLFDLNLRNYLGKGRAVNAAIESTASDDTTAPRFWFLNNGITITCDRFDVVPLPENPHVKMRNLQIVNGCQTASAIAQAANSKALKASAQVLARIYSAGDPTLAADIVITTNNQNKITSRDLKSNDAIQSDLQQALSAFGINYERKTNEFDRNPNVAPSSIVQNEHLGQCYMAVYLKKPADARRRKYKLWSEYYAQVFKSSIPIRKYVAAVRFGDAAEHWLRTCGKQDDEDDIVRKLAKNCSMHLARAAAYIVNGNSDHWPETETALNGVLRKLENGNTMAEALEQAFALLEAVLRADKTLAADIDNAIKSSKYESDVDAELHRR